MTAWRRLRDRTEAGVWPRLHGALLTELRRADLLDPDDCSVDGSHVRALKGGITPALHPSAVKTLLADLAACPSLGATARQPQPDPLLDNIEGMAVTGYSTGRLKVLLVSDDNQNAVQTTRLYALRVRV